MSLIQDPHDDGSLDGRLAVLDEHSAHTAEGPDRRRIADAFAFGRARKDGDESSVGVATICAGVMPDTAAICAALLYGVVSR